MYSHQTRYRQQEINDYDRRPSRRRSSIPELLEQVLEDLDQIKRQLQRIENANNNPYNSYNLLNLPPVSNPHPHQHLPQQQTRSNVDMLLSNEPERR